MVVTNHFGEVVPWNDSEHAALREGYNVDCDVGLSGLTSSKNVTNCTNLRGCRWLRDVTHCHNVSDCCHVVNSQGLVDCDSFSHCSRLSDITGCCGFTDVRGCENLVNWNGLYKVRRLKANPALHAYTGLFWLTLHSDLEMMQIGCQLHDINYWMSVEDSVLVKDHYPDATGETLRQWHFWRGVVREMLICGGRVMRCGEA